MARERASSGLPMMDESLLVGPRIPDELKRMIPHLTAIDKFLFRKILQGNLAYKYRLTFIIISRQDYRLRAVSLFSWSVEQNARDTQMTTRLTEGARRERHKKRETTRKARENGLSRSSDFFGIKTEVLTGQARET